MNMANHPDPRAAWPLDHEAKRPSYDIAIRVSVEDAGLLWRSAAAQLLSFGGMDEAGLEEMIGPRADPCVTSCIGVLLGPDRRCGVRYDDFTICALEQDDAPQRYLCGG